MITKIDNGLYKVELATRLSKPNVNNVNYDVDSFFNALYKMKDCRKVLTEMHQPSLIEKAHDDRELFKSIIVDDIIGSVVEIQYDADEPYIIVEPTNDKIEKYLDGDYYAGVRLWADFGRNHDLAQVTKIICWDIVDVCNWKNTQDSPDNN